MSGGATDSSFHISPEVQPLLASAGLRTFDDFIDFAGGTRICHKRGRSVFRLEVGGRAFYLKRNRMHRLEFWKGLSRLRLPRREARREWANIEAVRRAGIPTVTPVAMGERNRFGLETASFILTEELYGAVPLDRYLQGAARPAPASRQEKRPLLRNLARLARRLHAHGLNHQDFYFNHFFLGEDGTLFLLDLQRVQTRPEVPLRYRVKDLGQLNYSAQVVGGFSRTDRLRFLLDYLERSRLGASGKQLARRIAGKTARIARHDIKLLARRRQRGELPPG